MFKIGDFSRITQVSIRRLRHYDKIGLLTPAHTDPETGYRYYTINQLETVNRIVSLQDLGLSLTQIGQLLHDNITQAEIRGMLLLRKQQAEEAIQRERFILASVESRLEELEQAGTLSEFAPVLKAVPEQTILSVRQDGHENLHLGPLLYTAARAIQVIPDHQQSVAIFYGSYFDTPVENWEYGYLVTPDAPERIPLMEDHELVRRTLPELSEVISMTIRGRFVHLHKGYSAIGRWIDAHSYRITGDHREVFHELYLPEEGDKNLTEIQFPVEPIA